MSEFRRATVDDLPILAHIHKTAYSRSHFTALLPDKVLMRYYSYFLGDGSEICLALDGAAHCDGACVAVESVQGYAVFGVGIPEKIARFQRECRRDIIFSSLLHPWSAARKILNAALSRLKRQKVYAPSEFLLLSIAVATPRRGVGRSLLNAMLGIAQQERRKVAGLYVNADNVSAINAYFSAGFVIAHFQGGQFYMERTINESR